MPLTTRVPQNGGVGHRVVGGDVGPRRHVLRRRDVGTARRAHPALAQRRQLGAGDAALHRDERVHQPQPLEGVAGVADLALVDLGQVLLDVGPGQGGAAEDHRPAGREPPGVHLLEVLLHDDRRLHEQPGHADDVGPVLVGGVEDRGDRLLDADVDDVVAVVGQDDVDEVLADVVDVALDRGEHDGALAVLVGLLHVRLEVRDGGLHHLGRLQHERQLHLALAEELADDLHALEQVVVDDVEGRPAGVERGLQVGLEAVALAVDDPAGQPLPQRQRGELLGAGRTDAGRVHALEEVEEASAAGRSPRGAGRRPGRGRPRGPPRRSWSSAGSWRRARSPSRGRP